MPLRSVFFVPSMMLTSMDPHIRVTSVVVDVKEEEVSQNSTKLVFLVKMNCLDVCII